MDFTLELPVFTQKSVKPCCLGDIWPNPEFFCKKGLEKIRKGELKMIHWGPTEEEPKGKAESGERA